MYEIPKLNKVGDAQDVILGLVPSGTDIDANWVAGGFEFAAEAEFAEE
jgi:hypothetical protein